MHYPIHNPPYHALDTTAGHFDAIACHAVPLATIMLQDPSLSLWADQVQFVDVFGVLPSICICCKFAAHYSMPSIPSSNSLAQMILHSDRNQSPLKSYNKATAPGIRQAGLGLNHQYQYTNHSSPWPLTRTTQWHPCLHLQLDVRYSCRNGGKSMVSFGQCCLPAYELSTASVDSKPPWPHYLGITSP